MRPAAEFRRLRGQGLGGGRVGDVAAKAAASAPPSPDQRGGFLGAVEVDVGDRHAVAAAGEAERERPARGRRRRR